MKFRTNLNLLLLTCFLSACTSKPAVQPPIPTDAEHLTNLEHVDYSTKDSLILMDVFQRLEDQSALSLGDLVVETGRCFYGTPYLARTLEKEGKERLVINLRELDCLTYGENCLAIARCIKKGKTSFPAFCEELKTIRYRDGKLDGYPSRLHYFCDWIHNNKERGLVQDVSFELKAFPLERKINFMSTHPGNYTQLVEDSSLVEVIAGIEDEINQREMYYIPETEIAAYEEYIHDGDILGITTNIEGLAIQHVTVAVKKDGRVHIQHASSSDMEVVLSKESLEAFLLGSKRATGVVIVRPV